MLLILKWSHAVSFIDQELVKKQRRPWWSANVARTFERSIFNEIHTIRNAIPVQTRYVAAGMVHVTGHTHTHTHTEQLLYPLCMRRGLKYRLPWAKAHPAWWAVYVSSFWALLLGSTCSNYYIVHTPTYTSLPPSLFLPPSLPPGGRDHRGHLQWSTKEPPPELWLQPGCLPPHHPATDHPQPTGSDTREHEILGPCAKVCQ